MTDNSRFGGHPVIQDWVIARPFMQQSVILACIRGPDGMGGGHPVKDIIRWFRRCTLHNALGGPDMLTAHEAGGQKFTGPTQHPGGIDAAVIDFLDDIDGLPLHYAIHLMHAAECVAYGHPDADIAMWWYNFYEKMVHGFHLNVESSRDFNQRLGGTVEGWRKRDVVGITDKWAAGFEGGHCINNGSEEPEAN